MGQPDGATVYGQRESTMVAELKAGSEDAYCRLIAQYHQPIYGLVYRILDDPSDAPDTTQEVFLKVVRGIQSFNGASSLKTWLYRIAVHEASNRRRWWFRHKRREKSLAFPAEHDTEGFAVACDAEMVIDEAASPLEMVLQRELRAKVEQALKAVPEPYRTTVILRDLEDLSYEQIAEVMEISSGTVKSRLARGRQALRKRLQRCARELGLHPGDVTESLRTPKRSTVSGEVGGMQVEGSG